MQLSIEIPDDIFLAINHNKSELSNILKEKLAIELYKKNKISISQGAKLLDIDIYSFMKLLNENQVPTIDNYDIEAELKNL